MHAAVALLPCHAPTEQRVTMLVTVEASSVTMLRRAIMATCGESVDVIRIQPVPRSAQVRLWLCLAQPAATDAMSVIMRVLPCGEEVWLKVVYDKTRKSGVFLMVDQDHPPFARSEYAV
jgi:hypothetical protein